MSEGARKLQREAAARERRILAELDRAQRRRDVTDQPNSGSDQSEGGRSHPDFPIVSGRRMVSSPFMRRPEDPSSVSA
jgi:hypothetical protein